MSIEVLEKALKSGRAAQAQLLDVMEAVQSSQRPQEAPQLLGSVAIEKELIGRLIGPKGVAIQALRSATGACLSIDDIAGSVQIYAPTAEQFKRAEDAVLAVGGGNLIVRSSFDTYPRAAVFRRLSTVGRGKTNAHADPHDALWRRGFLCFILVFLGNLL